MGLVRLKKGLVSLRDIRHGLSLKWFRLNQGMGFSVSGDDFWITGFAEHSSMQTAQSIRIIVVGNVDTNRHVNKICLSPLFLPTINPSPLLYMTTSDIKDK
jgi:hypothetical protein